MKSSLSSFTFPNGLTIIHSLRPENLTVSLSLRVIAGSIYESFEEIGVAHFLEHIVSDGTEKYPSKKLLTNLIDKKGGFRNAFTNKETIEYVVKVLKEESETAFEYISEITKNPLIREEDIQKQKNIIEQEINRFKSDPEKLAQRQIYSLLFPGIRVGGLVTGDVGDVKRITGSSIRSYHNKTHNTKNMVLVVCGNISLVQAKEFTVKYFGDMRSDKKLPLSTVQVVQRTEPLVQVIPGLKQAILTVGYRAFKTDEPEHYVTDLLSMVLTRSKSSRLYTEIREKNSLAYSINSSNFNGRNIGIFSINVGLAKDKILTCLNIIHTELKNITLTPISDIELNRALAFIKSSIVFSFENTLNEASHYSNFWCSTNKIQSVDQELLNYESVAKNPDKILATAQKLFSVKPSILVTSAEIIDLDKM
ncbi:MAG: pitrilysin family protein [Patescibacteria group bacterium]